MNTHTFRILTDGISSEDNSSMSWDAIEEEQPQKIIKILIFDSISQITSKIMKDNYVRIVNATLVPGKSNHYFRLSSKSRVFSVSGFEVSEDMLKNYYEAPLLSLSEIFTSSNGRNVSLKGRVSFIGDTDFGETWKKRVILITEPQTGKEIRITFWREKIVLVEKIKLQDYIFLKNFMVSLFGLNRISLNSYAQTEIEILPQEPIRNKLIRIVGVDEDDDSISILDEEELIYNISNNILEESEFTRASIKESIGCELIISGEGSFPVSITEIKYV